MCRRWQVYHECDRRNLPGRLHVQVHHKHNEVSIEKRSLEHMYTTEDCKVIFSSFSIPTAKRGNGPTKQT